MGRSEDYCLKLDHERAQVETAAQKLLSTADGMREVIEEMFFDSNAERAFYSMLIQIDRASELGQFLEVWASRVADRKIP